MATRQELENNPNWQSTFAVQTEEGRGNVICLMRDAKGGFFWAFPNYLGLFPWGATATFYESALSYDLSHNHVRLVAGQWPPVGRPASQDFGTSSSKACPRR
ncbi:MAG TPA: hypothetical protein VMV69_11010 [Pirellulales bacterium]|nr:hypothetical protein [Pirellulales bacterium]